MPKQETQQVNVRIPVAIIKTLDLIIDHNSHLAEFMRPRTRSDVIRIMLVSGLVEAAYVAPAIKWRINCTTQEEENREIRAVYGKEFEEYEFNYGHNLGTFKTRDAAEKKLKEFLTSEDGYTSGYGRRDFNIYAVNEQVDDATGKMQQRPLDDLLRNTLGSDVDTGVAMRAIETKMVMTAGERLGVLEAIMAVEAEA